MGKTDLREVIVKAKIVTPDNRRMDEKTRKRIQNSNISSKDVLYPYFTVQFKTYDPFPKQECIEELQMSIEESVVSGDQLASLVDRYSTEDVINADPVGKEETETFRIGKAFLDEKGDGSMTAIDLSVFQEVLDSNS